MKSRRRTRMLIPVRDPSKTRHAPIRKTARAVSAEDDERAASSLPGRTCIPTDLLRTFVAISEVVQDRGKEQANNSGRILGEST